MTAARPDSDATPRVSRRFRAALLSGFLLACSPVEDDVPRALVELERLAFVARAQCKLDQHDLSLERALVFDRFELTRADLAHYLGARAAEVRSAFQGEAALDAPGREDWPAFLTFHEAAEVASLRGMRLPTPREWLHVAVGRRDYAKPWGGSGREYFANTRAVDADGRDFSLGTPSRVGTYENGKSRPFGCYDLHGNVWEWVDGVVAGSLSVAHDHDPLDDELGLRASVLGGAYNAPPRATYEDRRFFARTLQKGELAPWVGARMCAPAEDYLWAKAGQWGSGAQSRARVAAVGRQWAEADALAAAELPGLLAGLLARPEAPEGLRWLLAGVEARP